MERQSRGYAAAPHITPFNLPYGWVAKFDKTSSQTYYYHRETRKKQWKPPPPDDFSRSPSPPARSPSPSSLRVSSPAPRAQRPLPGQGKTTTGTYSGTYSGSSTAAQEGVGRKQLKDCMYEISNCSELVLTKVKDMGEENKMVELSGLPFEIHTKQYFETRMLDECAWLELPESIIGLEVGITLGKYQLLPPEPGDSFAKKFHDNFNTVRLGTLSVAMLTFTLQFYIVWCLWRSLPTIVNDEGLCRGQIGRPLQLCSVGVFFVSVIPAFKDITLELMVVLTSHRLQREANESDTNRVREVTSNPYWQSNDLVHIRMLGEKHPRWIFACLFIIILELVIWIMTLFVGCKFLLVSETVSDLVQSMVAIVFINDVDNLAFDVLVPRNVKKTLSRIQFEVPYLKGPGGRGEGLSDDGDEYYLSRSTRIRLQKNLYKMSLLGTVPFIIVLAVAVVYGVHAFYC